MELSKLCRICLRDDGVLSKLVNGLSPSDVVSSPTIMALYELLTESLINKKNKSKAKICHRCKTIIHDMYNLIIISERASSILNQMRISTVRIRKWSDDFLDRINVKHPRIESSNENTVSNRTPDKMDDPISDTTSTNDNGDNNDYSSPIVVVECAESVADIIDSISNQIENLEAPDVSKPADEQNAENEIIEIDCADNVADRNELVDDDVIPESVDKPTVNNAIDSLASVADDLAEILGDSMQVEQFNKQQGNEVQIESLATSSSQTQCTLCRKFIAKNDFSFHCSEHERRPYEFFSRKQGGIFTCPKCLYLIGDSARLVEHLDTIHKYCLGDELVCGFCTVSFYTQASLVDHRRNHSESKTFQCRLCLIDLFRKDIISHLRNHLTSSIDRILHSCEKCKGQFTKGQLELHTKLKCVFNCFYCSEIYYTQVGLKSHMISEHGVNKVFSCPMCYFQLLQNQELIDRHLKNESMKCSKCNHRFTQASDLAAHQRYHENISAKHKCHICKFGYNLKTQLAQHIVDHSQMNHLCLYCHTNIRNDSCYSRFVKYHQQNKFNSNSDSSKIAVIDLSQEEDSRNEDSTAVSQPNQTISSNTPPLSSIRKLKIATNMAIRGKKKVTTNRAPTVAFIQSNKRSSTQSISCMNSPNSANVGKSTEIGIQTVAKNTLLSRKLLGTEMRDRIGTQTRINRLQTNNMRPVEIVVPLQNSVAPTDFIIRNVHSDEMLQQAINFIHSNSFGSQVILSSPNNMGMNVLQTNNVLLPTSSPNTQSQTSYNITPLNSFQTSQILRLDANSGMNQIPGSNVNAPNDERIERLPVSHLINHSNGSQVNAGGKQTESATTVTTAGVTNARLAYQNQVSPRYIQPNQLIPSSRALTYQLSRNQMETNQPSSEQLVTGCRINVVGQQGASATPPTAIEFTNRMNLAVQDQLPASHMQPSQSQTNQLSMNANQLLSNLMQTNQTVTHQQSSTKLLEVLSSSKKIATNQLAILRTQRNHQSNGRIAVRTDLMGLARKSVNQEKRIQLPTQQFVMTSTSPNFVISEVHGGIDVIDDTEQTLHPSTSSNSNNSHAPQNAINNSRSAIASENLQTVNESAETTMIIDLDELNDDGVTVVEAIEVDMN